MKVYHRFDSVPQLISPVVTVGSFDGVHLGHRAILAMTLKKARETGSESVVVTFDPHPRRVLAGSADLLTTFPEKKCIIESCGIDNLLVIPFTHEFSRISYDDFLKDFIIDKLAAGVLVVGYDHSFGRDKRGNYESLSTEQLSGMPEIIKVSETDVCGNKVNSTRIRELINAGDLHAAGKLLGHPYFAVGTIGPQGRFKTGDADKLLPPDGNYDVSVTKGASCSRVAAEIKNRRMYVSTPPGYNSDNESVTVIFHGAPVK